MNWQAILNFLARLRGSSPRRIIIPQPLDFTVDESAVKGSGGKRLVNSIYGTYTGRISQGSGTFDLSAFVNFTAYSRDPGNLVASLLNVPGAQGYGLYATVVASGNFRATGVPDPSLVMRFTAGEGHVFLDPLLDTSKVLPAAAGNPIVLSSAGDDREVLSTTSVLTSQSAGIVRTGFGGSFQIVFTKPVVPVPAGTDYWLGLPTFGLRVLIHGDIRDTDLSGGTIAGAVSLEFQEFLASSDLFPA